MLILNITLRTEFPLTEILDKYQDEKHQWSEMVKNKWSWTLQRTPELLNF